jgi:hypothetical protein
MAFTPWNSPSASGDDQHASEAVQREGERVLPTKTATGVKVDDMDLAPPKAESRFEVQWCEQVYQEAMGESGRIPWNLDGPCPILTEWLNVRAPRLIRPGSRAVVVGCGLGDDVVELVDRGYDALGFDVSESAIKWANRRHPHCAGRFLMADLLNLPPRMLGRFDFVAEVGTLQSMPIELRTLAAKCLAKLLTPRGVMVAIACGRDDAEAGQPIEGPPWPISDHELDSLMATAGLGIVSPAQGLVMPGDDHLRVMGVYVRG